MLKIFLVAILIATITAACGAPALTSTVTTVTVQPTPGAKALPTPEAKALPKPLTVVKGYWAMPQNKAFKSLEWACHKGNWTSMDTGCVIVIDRTQKGFAHNGLNGPFGVVLPQGDGVTIKPAEGWNDGTFVSAKAKTYSFVVIDDKGVEIVHSFETQSPKWDEELLREFFDTQMGGEVETIWREGAVDID